MASSATNHTDTSPF